MSDSENLNDQTEAMVDPAKNSLERNDMEEHVSERTSDDMEEHVSERTSDGLERPILKRKLMGKIEKAKTKGCKQEEREIEEEFKAL